MNPETGAPNPRLVGRLGEDNLKLLAESEAGIVGVGSLGSRIAVELGSMGLGHMTLVDPDNISSDIIFRHVVGRSWIDQPKVMATKYVVEDKSDCQVWAVNADVREEPGVLAGVNLVIVAGLGSESTDVEVGHLATNMGLPVMGVGVYRQARGGEMSLVKPENDGPCPTCISSWMGRNRLAQVSEQTVLPAYGQPADQIMAEPGLGAEIGIIANIAALAAMRYLIKQPPFDMSAAGEDKYNTLVYGTRPINIRPGGEEFEVLGPLAHWLLALPKYPGCHVCFTDTEPRKPLTEIISGWKGDE